VGDNRTQWLVRDPQPVAPAVHGRARVLRFLLLGLPAAACGLPVLGLIASSPAIGGRLLVAGVYLLSAVRPQDALLVVAGLAPLGAVLGAMLDLPASLTEPLVLSFLAGWLAREAVRPSSPLSLRSRRLLAPVAVLAAAALSSAAVWLVALQPHVAYPEAYARELLRFAWSDCLVDRNSFPPFTDGMLFLEGLALFAAVVVLAERDGRVPRALVRMTVAAASGVAALSVNRVAVVVLRSGDPWQALQQHLPTMRVSAAFPDHNAAGSYFVMAGCVAAGLMFGARSARRWLALPVALIAGGLWLTASRAALFAAPAACLLALVLVPGLGGRLGRGRTRALAAALVVALPTTLLLVARGPDRASVRVAAEGRYALAAAGVRMSVEHPVFGVGIGRFKALSTAYLAPEYRRVIGSENAHNNLLQILAELGLAGFVPFAWLLVAVTRRVWPRSDGGGIDPLAVGAGTGVTAFILTCLAGHPLLIREVFCAFWLALGACAGLSGGARQDDPVLARLEADGPPAVGGNAAGRRLCWLVVPAALLILLTIPFRAVHALESSDLSDAAIGLSGWETDGTGTPGRRMTVSRAQFFVPADVRGARLSFLLESADAGASSEVSVLVDGRMANRIRLRAGVRLVLPMDLPARKGPGFRRVELRLDGPRNPARAVVWVGKPQLGRRLDWRPTPGDFNDDGHADVVWRHSSGQNVVWFMRHDGFQSQAMLPAEPNGQWRIAAVADMNGDDRPDLVWRNSTTGWNVVWYLEGVRLASQATLPPEPNLNWHIVAALTRKADGRQFLFWHHATTGQNVAWQLRGASLESQTALPAMPDAAWSVAAFANIDDDGRLDLVWSDVATRQNLLWKLRGTTLLSASSLPPLPGAEWRIVAAGDYEGDRTTNVMLRNRVTGENMFWYRESGPSYYELRLPTVTDHGWVVAGPPW
jgi:hypothetical protein